MRLFGLDLAGRRVLVVGGGAVGTRRALALAADGAHVTVVAPQLDPALASAPGVEAVARAVREADLEGVWLVVAATDSPEINTRVSGWAQARRLWCVQAADAGQGSARMVAQARHEDVVFGVVSAGEPDPQRSLALRDAFAALVAEGAVVPTPHRGAPDRAVSERTAPDRTAPEKTVAAGRVILVGAGPGAADLITVRGRRALAGADVVVHDRLGTAELLAALPGTVERIDVGKRPDHHPVPQEQINALLVEHALAGRAVVRLKGGDPFVLGRGGEEVQACVRAGVPVEVVPGLSSAIAGPALAGIPVTDRAVTAGVLIAAGHEGLDAAALAALREGVTVVLLMGVGSLGETVAAAVAEGIDPHLPVAVVESASLPQQRVTRAPLDGIVARCAQVGVTNPAVIVMGPVAGEDFLVDRTS